MITLKADGLNVDRIISKPLVAMCIAETSDESESHLDSWDLSRYLQY